MRSDVILALASLTLLVSTPALAHTAHGPCPESSTALNNRIVHVDTYRRGCQGVTVILPALSCDGFDLHLVSGLHVPVLYGPGCETGVVLETLETGLLP